MTGFVRVMTALGASIAMLAACSLDQQRAAPPASTTDPSAALVVYLDAQYEQDLRQSPERMTGRGRKDRYSELDDRSEAAAAARLAWRRASVAQMQAKFDPNQLNEDARLSYDIWALELQRAEEEDQWRRHRYIFARGGAPTGLPNFLINQHRVDEESDMEAYIARVARVDEALDQLLVRAKAAASDGIHMPTFTYDQSLDEIRRVVSGAPFTEGADCALFADAKSKIGKLEDAGKITAEQARQLTQQAAQVMVQQMKPAYDRVAAFLLEDKPNGQQPQLQGALALPNGAKFYESALYLQTTTRMTADEIHNLGLAEVARLRQELERAKVAAGFQGTLAELFVYMRTDRRFFLPNNDAGAAQYIKLAEGYLSGMQAKLPQYFGILPKAPLVVKRVEPFREQPGGAQHYMAGTPDGSRPGIFYAHLSDMNAMATHQLESIAYHEGVPGHHLQISIQRELTGLPVFRTQSGYAAYSEGWGLYAEALAKEMGFNSDPYSELGRLTTEMWRAIRLVVDTGIHSKGWTQQQAEEYFLANSPQPAQAVKSEIERYILGPGQATSYKIGMITIQRLRDEARTALGAKFDYRRFHDTVLGGGALPLPVLEAKVRRWIEREKRGV
jgi:uncharacterized protein (DUF885 family)